MSKAFEGATHIWTPGYDNPYPHKLVFRRHEYRKQQDGWYVKDIVGDWVKSGNYEEWFKMEIEEGYLVTIDEFNSPDFKSKEVRV